MRRMSTFLLTLAFGVTQALQSLAAPMAELRDGDTLAFVGDSITAGGASSYPGLVVHGLKTKGIRVKPVYAGIPGNKSSDMLLRLDRVLMTEPDFLFLSVGVNDVWHTDPTAKLGVYKPSPGMGVELEHYKIYVPQILDRCKAAGTTVIMSTFTQITEDPEHRLNKKAVAYNDFLRAQAKQRNLPIALLNEAAFAKIAELRAERGVEGDKNVLSSDGVHPGPTGLQTMAKGVLVVMGFSEAELAAVEQEWNAPSRILIIGDSQASAGGRAGGWSNMLLEGLNRGRAMVSRDAIVSRKTLPLAELAGKVQSTSLKKGTAALDSAEEPRPREEDRLKPALHTADSQSSPVRSPRPEASPGIKLFSVSRASSATPALIIIPPLWDLQQKTPLDAYEKTLLSLVGWSEAQGIKCCIATFPVLDGKETGNADVAPYNEVIRKVCQSKGVVLADIHAAMKASLEKSPDVPLLLSRGRVNHQGGTLLAEAIYTALGGDQSLLPELRQTWDSRTSFTFRYSHPVTVEIPFSEAGKQALQEISERYHKLGVQGAGLGFHLLLNGDAAENRKRLEYVDANWLSDDPEAATKSFRLAPRSADELRAIEAYTEKEGIDLKTFCERAVKVEAYALRKENLLGRGAY
jgi:lysophospholipase L1-like esterase